MSADEGWGRGYVDGYRSQNPSAIPAVPARPADYPASLAVDALEDYFYRLGYEAGCREAQG